MYYREWHSQVANKPAIVKTGSALQKKLVSSINNTIIVVMYTTLMFIVLAFLQ